jgi:hypothetical protein
MARSKRIDVARGLLLDAFVSYVAICREKNYNGKNSFDSWREALDELQRNMFMDGSKEERLMNALTEGDDANILDVMIEERRGLIRDTMREEMEDLEAASPSSEDAEGIRDREQG